MFEESFRTQAKEVNRRNILTFGAGFDVTEVRASFHFSFFFPGNEALSKFPARSVAPINLPTSRVLVFLGRLSRPPPVSHPPHFPRSSSSRRRYIEIDKGSSEGTDG